MSLLTQLLKAKDNQLTLALNQLEELTDRPGVDTALIGEILQKAYAGAGKMGLDPDFNAQELYHSLLNRVKADNARMAAIIGGKRPDDLYHMVPLITQYVQKLDVPQTGWFLKLGVAKRMLRQMPPLQVMSRLGYKKVSDLLAGENLFEVYGALRFAESPEWLNKFIALYRDLTFKDFEHRRVHLINFDEQKWGNVAEHFIAKKLHNITHLKELGVIMTMPVARDSQMSGRGITLKALPLLIHYYNEIHLYSTFFKLISVKDDFGPTLVDTLIADTPRVSLMPGRKIHWRVIQRYYGKQPASSHPEIFEPHVQPEDLHWRKAEDVLYDVDPELKFWRDMDYVGLEIEGEIVAFNLMDVALSYANEVRFPERNLYHFREALWNELFMRYLGQRTLEEQILRQLDNELIAPEKIRAQATTPRAKQ